MGSETYFDAQTGHLVNGAQRLHIISSEAIRRTGENMRELALTRVG
ncbi:hypothetical protein QPK87_28550 [Kamptonema cortianum]|nr:hypothetical protein [Kamptonema cortianum]